MNQSQPHPLTRVVSGGQTGVDQAALDAAINLGIPHGGWCPRGRLSEDGPIPSNYQLKETKETRYHVRTEKNVIDSDGTLILFSGELSGGTAFTLRMAKKNKKPCLWIDIDQPIDAELIHDWFITESIGTLNVAGPRESSQPGIMQKTRQILLDIFRKALSDR